MRPIPPVKVATATVYVAAGRRYLTRAAAYRKLAAQAVRARYRCTCEAETHFTCGAHDEAALAHVELRIARLARWLAWRDAVLEWRARTG